MAREFPGFPGGFLQVILLLSFGGCGSWAQGTARFAVLGDRTGGADQAAFRRVVQDIARLKPDFVVTVGDAIEAYGHPLPPAKQWDALREDLRVITCPIYFTPGNHDIFDSASAALFASKTGHPPDYSFDEAAGHFIVLNTATVDSYDQLDPVQLAWLKADLEAHRRATNIFVVTHKPLGIDLMQQGKPDAVHQLFRQYPVRAVIAGHWHEYLSEEREGIRYFVVGSSGGAFGQEHVDLGRFVQFLWCTVKGTELEACVVKAGATYDATLVNAAEHQMAGNIRSRYIQAVAQLTEGISQNTLNVAVAITNATDQIIRQELIWKTEANWSGAGSTSSVQLAPRAVFTHHYTFQRTGPLYPLPVLTFAYPFGRGKTYPYASGPSLFKTASLAKPQQAPVIDGQITPSEWERAVEIRDFCNPEGGPSATEPTRALLLADDHYLYIAVSCTESQMTQLQAKATQRDDPVYNDDCVGILLSGDRKSIYMYYVNPAGTVWDLQHTVAGGDQDPRWNGHLQAVGSRSPDQWMMEMRLPLSDLGLSLGTRELRMNIQRLQQRNQTSALWNPVPTLDTRTFGTLNLP